MASRNAAFSRLPSRLSAGSYGNGQVRVDVGVARVVDEVLDDLDRELRGDLAGRVAAHAVGHHVQAEVGTRAVRVFVLLPAQARMGRDGRRKGSP